MADAYESWGRGMLAVRIRRAKSSHVRGERVKAEEGDRSGN